MHVSWLGLSTFKLETGSSVIVTDPYAPEAAPRPLRVKADVVTITHPGSAEYGYVGAVSGEPFVIDHPGEFEVKGAYVTGVSLAEHGRDNEPAEEIPRGKLTERGPKRSGRTRRELRGAKRDGTVPSTIFTYDLEGLRLAHLGGVREVPPDAVLEKIDGVDLLFLPVGGRVTLEPEAAMRVVNAIEPRIVIPMHFQQEGWKLRERLQPVAAFLREIGASAVEPVGRFSVKKRELTGEDTRVVVLTGER